MGIATGIGRLPRAPGKIRLGKDHPVYSHGFFDYAIECGRIGQNSDVAEERKLVQIMGSLQRVEKKAVTGATEPARGRRQPCRQSTQRHWLSDKPPPRTMQWICG